MLLKQDPPDEGVLLSLIPVALKTLEREAYERFDAEFRHAYPKRKNARRTLYLEDLKRYEQSQKSGHIWAHVLQPEDLEWLRQKATEMDKEVVWKDVLRLATYHVADLGRKKAARRMVKHRRPELYEEFEKTRKRYQMQKRRSEQRRAREEAEERAVEIVTLYPSEAKRLQDLSRMPIDCPEGGSSDGGNSASFGF
jgi:phage portal protein BeeE